VSFLGLPSPAVSFYSVSLFPLVEDDAIRTFDDRRAKSPYPYTKITLHLTCELPVCICELSCQHAERPDDRGMRLSDSDKQTAVSLTTLDGTASIDLVALREHLRLVHEHISVRDAHDTVTIADPGLTVPRKHRPTVPAHGSNISCPLEMSIESVESSHSPTFSGSAISGQRRQCHRFVGTLEALIYRFCRLHPNHREGL